jgi:hypothetical protein
MSTPLFIREPVLGTDDAAIQGTDFQEIVAAVDEPTLIEEFAWAANLPDTTAGQLFVLITKAAENPRLVGVYSMAAAPGAGLNASGRIPFNIPLPVGYSLLVKHTVLDTFAASAEVHVVPVGGVLR